jgi:hypothetical protein
MQGAVQAQMCDNCVECVKCADKIHVTNPQQTCDNANSIIFPCQKIMCLECYIYCIADELDYYECPCEDFHDVRYSRRSVEFVKCVECDSAVTNPQQKCDDANSIILDCDNRMCSNCYSYLTIAHGSDYYECPCGECHEVTYGRK